MIIVDGGYMAWLYGTDSFGHNGWTSEGRKKYSRNAGALMLLDSDQSFRKQYDPNYKSRRKEKRDEDPERQAKWEAVHQFKDEVLTQDPSLATVQVGGFEADDLVAVVIQQALVPLPVRIIGIDKDLLQFPRGSCVLQRAAGDRASIKNFAERHPKALIPHIRHPMHVLLSLCLMGDKSDSIERLIPPRQLDIMVDLLNADRPFARAYDRFGDDFLRNLYLAILPSPWCIDPVPTEIEVLNWVNAGMWWNLQIRSDITEYLKSVIETIPQDEEEDDDDS